MDDNWITIEIFLSTEAVEAVAGFLAEISPSGCIIDDVDDGFSMITVYCKNSEWGLIKKKLTEFLRNLVTFFPDISEPRVSIESLKTENWALAWQESFKRMEVGSKLMIAPPWDIPKKLSGRSLVVIEPAEAFGTGTHETTQGCLILLEQAVDKIVQELKSFSLLDAGCGSGILALCAARLGVDHITAIDVDPVAVASAIKNRELNAPGKTVDIRVSDLNGISNNFDIVTANLDFMTLINNVTKLSDLFKRCLIVSGITNTQWPKLIANFADAGLKCIDELHNKEWATGLFVHTE